MEHVFIIITGSQYRPHIKSVLQTLLPVPLLSPRIQTKSDLPSERKTATVWHCCGAVCHDDSTSTERTNPPVRTFVFRHGWLWRNLRWLKHSQKLFSCSWSCTRSVFNTELWLCDTFLYIPTHIQAAREDWRTFRALSTLCMDYFRLALSTRCTVAFLIAMHICTILFLHVNNSMSHFQVLGCSCVPPYCYTC